MYKKIKLIVMFVVGFLLFFSVPNSYANGEISTILSQDYQSMDTEGLIGLTLDLVKIEDELNTEIASIEDQIKKTSMCAGAPGKMFFVGLTVSLSAVATLAVLFALQGSNHAYYKNIKNANLKGFPLLRRKAYEALFSYGRRIKFTSILTIVAGNALSLTGGTTIESNCVEARTYIKDMKANLVEIAKIKSDVLSLISSN